MRHVVRGGITMEVEVLGTGKVTCKANVAATQPLTYARPPWWFFWRRPSLQEHIVASVDAAFQHFQSVTRARRHFDRSVSEAFEELGAA